MTGKRIADYKLIIDHQVEGETYMDSYQWRFYLDIFNADVFDYFIFQAHEVGANILHIEDVHRITQYRYPDLRERLRGSGARLLQRGCIAARTATHHQPWIGGHPC